MPTRRIRWMRNVLLLSIVLFSCCACSSANPSQSATPTAKQVPPTPTSLPRNTVLFQADWSRGLSSWQSKRGWTVKQGFIESDLSNNLSLTIPYQPKVANYAVEFLLQVVRIPQNGGQYQLVADPLPDKSGYSADILNLLAPGKHGYAVHPLSEILILPEEAMAGRPQVYDFEPTDQEHLYRVEVEGPRANFLVQGNRVSYAMSAKTQTLSNGPIRFLSQGAILRLKSLRVLAL